MRLLFFCTAVVLSAFARLAPAQETVHGNRISIDVYGNIFALDNEHSLLRLYNERGEVVREVGGEGWTAEALDKPAGVWARNGIDVFVADYGNHRIQRFDRTLHFISTFFTRESDNEAERFGYPEDVALSPLGDLFIIDGENIRIVKVDRFTTVERTFGGFDAGAGRLRAPKRISVGAADRIYVLDPPRVIVFDYSGNYLKDILPGTFTQPSSIHADRDGLLVLDGKTLYPFDAADRPLQPTVVQSAADSVRDVDSRNGKVYLLTGNGIQTVPDPRVGADAH